MPVKREIIYPIFLECCQFADNIFWESIFEDLAYGKTPSGTYISKDFLNCSYRNKEFSYKIERKDPETIYNDIYKLLTEKLGILSQKEKMQKKILFEEIEKNIKESRTTWLSIRKKNIKDILYERYILEMKKAYNLSNKDCRYLSSLINISMTFKTLSPKDIIYENDKITKIEGIDFEKEKIIFNRPLTLNKIIEDEAEAEDEEDEIIEQTSLLSDNWQKHLKMLRNN
jgi:hypothetical protein